VLRVSTAVLTQAITNMADLLTFWLISIVLVAGSHAANVRRLPTVSPLVDCAPIESPDDLPDSCSIRSGSCVTTQCTAEGADQYKACAPVQRLGATAKIPQVCANSVVNDRLLMNGTVRLVDASNPCGRPVRALLDIWQANADGVYSDISPSSTDFSCRTRLVTTDSGFYSYSTVMPGRYEETGFSPAHIHMKVTPLDSRDMPIGRPLLTEQFFANDMFLTASEGHSTMVVKVEHSSDIKTYDGTWDILLL